MAFDLPRWWWIGLTVGLFLLALGGALNAVGAGMWDNHASDGCGHRYGPGSADPPAGVDCSGQRLAIGVVEGVARATFGPGIAIAILAGVYLLGAAIAGGFARRNGNGQGGDPS